MTAKQRKKAKDAEPSEPTPPAMVDAIPLPGKSQLPGPPVVGIGASAGGLDAFKRFFAAMPADSGIAFVLIPHLDPKHESLMVELIARHTTMPVVEAVDGMAVEANRVYILPPNKYMTIAGGVLRLTGPVERGGLQTSIDLFLRSLAQDKQEKAVCIILSGTGSHGALGLKAVKASDGMAMVQDPSTAEYPRMPQSAIATGLADYVLPVEKMPEELIKYIQHFCVDGDKIGIEGTEAPDHLNQVLALLRARTKFDFRCYRRRMLSRQIERRMSLNHIDQIADYLAFLRDHPDEVKRMYRDLLISVTTFFRDPEAFQALETRVIAPLVGAKESDGSLRVWSTGCATGEEPFSLGILLLEHLAKAQKNCAVQIFATDVDEDALKVARQSSYLESIATDVSPERPARFFTRADEVSYRVTKQLREIVIFARQNLVSDAPFSKLDLIVCRNLLIYLEPEVQKKVIPLLHFSLNEGGFLFLGPSETIGRHIDLFETVSKKWRIYRRIGMAQPEKVEVPIVTAASPLFPARRGIAWRGDTAPAFGAARLPSFADMTHRLLLDQYAPPAVLINRQYEILYYFGDTDRYLAIPTGEPTQDLMMLAREGLRTKLRSAIHKAVRENSPVTLADAQVKRNGDYHPVIVTIRAVQGPQGEEGLLLITFQDSDLSRPVDHAPTLEARSPEHDTARQSEVEESAVWQLEHELKATKEDLQSTIEEMESSNEELKVSNEEVMSMNEEFQSANEELETSKEELQSLNEELGTVNSQLHEKVADLETANNDMANLLNCSEVAILFLDTRLRIKRFTPPATRFFNLIASDLDRPISDITAKISGNLEPDAQQVLRTLTPHEKLVQTPDGCWWSRWIIPYRTPDNRIEGLVLTFTDVTNIRLADEQSRRLATVLLDSNDAVYVHDFDGKISAWNRGAERLLGFGETEALKMNTDQLIPEASRAEAHGFWEQLRRGERVDSWEAQRRTKDGRILDVWVTATALRDDKGLPIAIAKTERDVTEQKRAERALRESETRFRSIFHEGTTPTAATFADGSFRQANRAYCEMLGYSEAELLATTFMVLTHPEDRETSTKEAARRLAAGEISRFRGQKRYLHKQGQIVWVDLSVSVVRHADGGLAYFISQANDITARKSAEEALRTLNDQLEQRVAERTQTVRNREASLQAILSTAADAIVSINADGIIQSVNVATERMFGFTAAEMIGQNVKMLMPAPYHDEHDRYLENYDKTGVKKVIGIGREVMAQRKDGSTFPVELAVSEVNHLNLYTGILSDITRRRELEREVVEIASLEQRRIGQDLHDSVGQELTALNILAGDLAESMGIKSANGLNRIEQMVKGLKRSQKELRSVMQGLLPVAVDAEGLTAALHDLADRIQQEGKVTCRFDCPEPVLIADNLTGTHLYLIAQEAVYNAIKHARPKNIRISLESNKVLLLRVQDDGIGMSAEPLANHGGLGLRIMRNRAAIIGATLTLQPVEPTGTRMTCALVRENHETTPERKTLQDPDRR